MRRRALFLIVGAGMAAAILAAILHGGKPVPASPVVELTMPPLMEPAPAPPPSLMPGDAGSAPKAAAADAAAGASLPEALTSAPPPGREPMTAPAAPPEPAGAATTAAATNGGLPMIVTRGSNMRAEPSVNASLVAHFKAGERVYRMEEKPVLGYYLVRSDRATGWIWWMNVAAERQPPSP